LESQKIFAEFPGKDNLPLSKLCLRLLEEQEQSWPALAGAYRALSAVRTRSMTCGNYEASLQFNPARAVSSGAAIDAESIKQRPCFLCADNLPPRQRGILYRDEYLILCNPAPIFASHFTVASIRHQAQEIAPSLNHLLQMAADLAPDYTILYNGPACGASAPDHLHFQIIPAGSLPFLNNLREAPLQKAISSVRLYRGKDVDRSVIILESENACALYKQFALLVKATRKIISINIEPPMNIFCSLGNEGWRLTIFFRRKHRPAAYFAQGEERIFVSPGAIDMAGVVVTPLLVDFNRLNCDNIRSIYQEVSLDADVLIKIIEEMKP
jgi:diadenosine tetraphosphate (Ap4A) HIT family hydrolase